MYIPRVCAFKSAHPKEFPCDMFALRFIFLA